MKALSVAGYLAMVVGLVGLVATRSLFSPWPLVIALQVAALGLMIWARVTFGRRSYHPAANPTEGGLITSGPYRFIRHPIYTGLLVMYVATAILLGRMGALIFGVPLVFASFWIKLRDEEEIMLKQFPEQYSAYQQRTARIIPFLL